jgi:YgiT-type zinc finger domain-containing protein
MKTCFYCKGSLEQRRIEHMHQWGGHRFLIKNVRAEVCSQCGEVFLPAASVKAIDRVVASGKPEGKLSIGVYDLKTRAA